MRFAIYYTPPAETVLHALASRWLGRDVYGCTCVVPIKCAAPFVSDARRYGFHATLKAPFSLRDGTSDVELLADVAALASRTAPVELAPLQLSMLHGFLSLRPSWHSAELTMLERRIVGDLDHLRAAPTADEIARRNLPALSPSQQVNFKEWGYPFVFADFQFHMTLSCHLEDAELETLAGLAEEHFAPVTGTPMTISAISVFQEEAPGAEFKVLKTFPLEGRTET